jgi:hypothetical protein
MEPMEHTMELPSEHGQLVRGRRHELGQRRGLELVPLAGWWLRQLGNRGVGRQHISLTGHVHEHRRMSIHHGVIRHVTLIRALC